MTPQSYSLQAWKLWHGHCVPTGPKTTIAARIFTHIFRGQLSDNFSRASTTTVLSSKLKGYLGIQPTNNIVHCKDI